MTKLNDFNKGFVCIAVYLNGNPQQREYYKRVTNRQLITVDNQLEALILDKVLTSWLQAFIEDFQERFPQNTYAIEKVEE